MTSASALLLTLGLTACGPTFDSAELDDAVAPTFANLYLRGIELSGQQVVPVPALQATAFCTRGGLGTTDEGPGDDWLCDVGFIDVTGLPQQIRYEVTWKPDGCYTAEGAPSVVGDATLTDAEGETHPNPVYAFDGCVT
jgi:hypothetical protein